MAKQKSPRCTNMMYVQKMDHLPIKNLTALKDVIEQQVRPKKYAMVVHDQERDADGNLINPDIHVMLSFDSARYISHIAKILGDKPQYIQAWRGAAENGYAYLVHATQQAREQGKHQYDPATVVANFDYQSYLVKIQTKAAQPLKSKDLSAKTLLDALYAGVLSRDEVESRLTGSQLGYYKRQIDTVWNKVLQNKAAEWRKEMIDKEKQVTVIWLYGTSGTGKTRFAKAIAKKTEQPYYVSGSSRDIFQSYAGEHTIILDELRPCVMAYQDLLRILDPYGLSSNVMAPARYSDKPLVADLIIVTSPFSPYAFWTKQFGGPEGQALAQTDGFDQLNRRISLTMEMQNATINLMVYDDANRNYTMWRSRSNPYSQQATPTTQNSAVELFGKLLD